MSAPAVPVVVSVMVGTSVAAQVAQGKWKTENGVRIFVGAALVGFALYALKGVGNGALGDAFSYFVILAALLTNGVTAISGITKGLR